MGGIEGFLDGIKGAGADVTVDDTQRSQRQGRAGLLQVRATRRFALHLQLPRSDRDNRKRQGPIDRLHARCLNGV